jgi:hypothetical protein
VSRSLSAHPVQVPARVPGLELEQVLVLVLVLAPEPAQGPVGLARRSTSSPTRRTSPEVMLAYR